MKTAISKEKMHVCVVNKYEDIQFLNFAIKDLRENEKVRKTILSIHMGHR